MSFFQDAASEMLYPVLPLFVTAVLGAPPVALGLIEGVAEGTAAFTKAWAGRLADRFRRRPIIAAGYSISGAAKPLIGLAQAWPFVLVARFFDRVGKGIRGAPRDALIAAETPPALRGKAFGVHRAFDSAGAVVGPLVGLGLYELLGHRLRPLFLLAAIPAAISVALVFLVHEHAPRRAATAATDHPHHHPLPPGHFGPRYWTAMVILGLFALVNFTDTLVLLRADELGLGFGAVIAAYALYNAVYSALSAPAGIVSDRLPRPLVFAAGLAVFAVAYTGLGLTTSAASVWLLLPLYGAYTALTDGVGKAWLADLLPATHLGRGLGYYQAIAGGGALVAGIWAGALWRGSGRFPLVVSGLVAGVLAVVLAVLAPTLDGRRHDAAH